MVFGEVLGKLKRIELTTADGRKIGIENGPISKLGFKIIGVPHIGVRARARRIMNNLPKEKSLRVLDAGFGTGVYSLTMAERSKQVDSVDIGKDKVNHARRVNPSENVRFREGDLRKLDFKDETFDIIICSEVLEHIREDRKAFSELGRVLKRGGTLLITVPHKSTLNKKFQKKYEHERAGYSREDFLRMCNVNGLTLLKTEGYSSKGMEKAFKINESLFSNKAALGLFFYPLYIFALIYDFLDKESERNGLFVKIKK